MFEGHESIPISPGSNFERLEDRKHLSFDSQSSRFIEIDRKLAASHRSSPSQSCREVFSASDQCRGDTVYSGPKLFRSVLSETAAGRGQLVGGGGPPAFRNISDVPLEPRDVVVLFGEDHLAPIVERAARLDRDAAIRLGGEGRPPGAHTKREWDAGARGDARRGASGRRARASA